MWPSKIGILRHSSRNKGVNQTLRQIVVQFLWTICVTTMLSPSFRDLCHCSRSVWIMEIRLLPVWFQNATIWHKTASKQPQNKGVKTAPKTNQWSLDKTDPQIDTFCDTLLYKLAPNLAFETGILWHSSRNHGVIAKKYDISRCSFQGSFSDKHFVQK